MIRDKYTHLDLSRQRKWQLRQRDKGKCITCGEPRVDATHCAKHAKAASAISLDYYYRQKDVDTDK